MTTYIQLTYKVFIIHILITQCLGDMKPPIVNPDVLVRSNYIAECQACKLFVTSFKNGLERTSRGKFEGGDADWEETKLKKSYKYSEMRLIDIQENICKEEPNHAAQCYAMAEAAEEHIEQLWRENAVEVIDLNSFICIDKLEMCCPPRHYGRNCTECPGSDGEKVCNGNGRCRGDGTRKGSGRCSCNPGFKAPLCDQCADGYYASGGEKLQCLKCHQSCMGGCRAGTLKDCVACQAGFVFDLDEGCLDVNECNDVSKCTKDQFCLNSIGSFMCMACDKSCNGCHGDGPDMCRKCADGYSNKGEFCVADREEEDPADLSKTRYMTYIGLLLATAILLPMSTTMGSLVGMMVLSYIIGAEYYCMINGHTGLVDLKDFDLMRLFRT